MVSAEADDKGGEYTIYGDRPAPLQLSRLHRHVPGVDFALPETLYFVIFHLHTSGELLPSTFDTGFFKLPMCEEHSETDLASTPSRRRAIINVELERLCSGDVVVTSER